MSLLSLLKGKTKTSIEQAKVTSVDKVKGRVSLYMKNGLVTTGSYLYDISELYAGNTVLVARLDDSYVILNKVSNAPRENVSYSLNLADEIFEVGDVRLPRLSYFWALNDVNDDGFDATITIEDTGNTDIIEYGFCYIEGTTGTPTINDSVFSVTGIFGIGDFNIVVTGLDPKKSYRVCPYIKNSMGVVYGEVVTITTGVYIETPTLITNWPSYITTMSMIISGEITNTGGENCTERGFVYSKGGLGNPVIDGLTPDLLDDLFNNGDKWAFTYGSGGDAFFAGGAAHLDSGESDNSSYMDLVAEYVGDFPNIFTIELDMACSSIQEASTGAGIIVNIASATKMITFCFYSDRLEAEVNMFGPTFIPMTISHGVYQFWRFVVNQTTKKIRVYATSTGDDPAYVGEISFNSLKDTTDTTYIMAVSGSEYSNVGAQIGRLQIATGDGVIGCEGTYVHDSGSFGIGSFEITVTGLLEGTTYAIRAVGKNSEGYGYGNTQQVTTVEAV